MSALYRLAEQFDRRYAAEPLPMVTLDFELDLYEEDVKDAAYFYVDFWLN